MYKHHSVIKLECWSTITIMGNRCNHLDTVEAIGVRKTRSETEPVRATGQEVKEQFTPNTAKHSIRFVQSWSRDESVHPESVSSMQAESTDLRPLLSKKDEEIESLRQQLYDKEQLISEIQETVETLKEKLLQLHQSLQGKVVLNWMEKVQVSTESMMHRGSAATMEGMAFFNAGSTSNIVYTYESFSQEWAELQPHCPHYDFTLVVVDGQLTAVGGSEQKYTPGSALLTFNEGEWTERFPRMSTKRMAPAALCIGHSLVVAGGYSEDLTAPLEILNTRTLQWHTTAHLLMNRNEVALNPTSMAACGGNLYVFEDNRTHVFTCSLSALLESSSQSSKEDTNSSDKQNGVSFWNRISDLPVSQSTAVTLCGQLLCAGGQDDKGDVDTIYQYGPATDTWTKLGKLLCPKTRPLVTTLSVDKLVVVHENYDRTFVGTAALTES